MALVWGNDLVTVDSFFMEGKLTSHVCSLSSNLPKISTLVASSYSFCLLIPSPCKCTVYVCEHVCLYMTVEARGQSSLVSSITSPTLLFLKMYLFIMDTVFCLHV